MDFYQEQHSYTLARNANANSSDEETDEDTSWVMMSRDGEVIKLPGEKIYYKVRSRIGLDVSTPKALPNATQFSIKSDGGIVYVTNNRIIYIPNYPTETFKSFSAPILDFEDTRVASSFFGPWTWNAIVKPTVGGNIPSDVPRLELKLTFREGGHDAFQTKFEVMKERLSYARTLQQETGQVIPTGEDLPQYEPPPPVGSGSAPPRQQQAPEHQSQDPTANDAKEREALERYARSQEEQTPRGAVPQDALLAGQANTSTPNEPPPDYEEAQAQAIGMRFEETMREAADRQ
ncbi:ww-domain ligand protein [Ophiostoma piceae UAMH 11346]|uniref:Ww-domain ligand protein n=1 Tax=Ophiostoma piceae (strain UAMH 11346) TaxID=1262450 RepID=S3CVE1_OPHP1|nr:ww-domain ligand protein [Ophiostoma piceae UAMH 11346]